MSATTGGVLACFEVAMSLIVGSWLVTFGGTDDIVSNLRKRRLLAGTCDSARYNYNLDKIA